MSSPSVLWPQCSWISLHVGAGRVRRALGSVRIATHVSASCMYKHMGDHRKRRQKSPNTPVSHARKPKPSLCTWAWLGLQFRVSPNIACCSFAVGMVTQPPVEGVGGWVMTVSVARVGGQRKRRRGAAFRQIGEHRLPGVLSHALREVARTVSLGKRWQAAGRAQPFHSAIIALGNPPC